MHGKFIEGPAETQKLMEVNRRSRIRTKSSWKLTDGRTNAWKVDGS